MSHAQLAIAGDTLTARAGSAEDLRGPNRRQVTIRYFLPNNGAEERRPNILGFSASGPR